MSDSLSDWIRTQTDLAAREIVRQQARLDLLAELEAWLGVQPQPHASAMLARAEAAVRACDEVLLTPGQLATACRAAETGPVPPGEMPEAARGVGIPVKAYYHQAEAEAKAQELTERHKRPYRATPLPGGRWACELVREGQPS